MDIDNLNNDQLNELLSNLLDKDDEYSLLIRSKIYLKLNNIDKALLEIINCLNKSNKYYYEAILVKLDCLIIKKQYIEALKVVEEELSMPYIPSDFETKYKEKYKEILNYFKDNSNSNKFKDYDDDKIGKLLISTTDIGILEAIIEQLRYRNIRSLLSYIKQYLSNPNKDNYVKSYLLLELNNQKVDDEVILVKDDLNISLIPSSLTPFSSLDYINDIKEFINKLNINKNITIEEISSNLLNAYILYKYPLDIDIDEYKYVGLALYIIATKSLCINIDNDNIISKYNLNKNIANQYIQSIENIVNLC